MNRLNIRGGQTARRRSCLDTASGAGEGRGNGFFWCLFERFFVLIK